MLEISWVSVLLSSFSLSITYSSFTCLCFLYIMFLQSWYIPFICPYLYRCAVSGIIWFSTTLVSVCCHFNHIWFCVGLTYIVSFYYQCVIFLYIVPYCYQLYNKKVSTMTRDLVKTSSKSYFFLGHQIIHFILSSSVLFSFLNSFLVSYRYSIQSRIWWSSVITGLLNCHFHLKLKTFSTSIFIGKSHTPLISERFSTPQTCMKSDYGVKG